MAVPDGRLPLGAQLVLIPMMTGDKGALAGVRVAILAVDGFEQVEVTLPRRALRKAGADVRIVSLRPGRIRGMNLLWRGRKLAVDDVLGRARPEDYGALLLPGGFINPDLLRQSERALEFVRRFEELGRPLATICHGPQVLISAGLLRGRRIASWPGISDDVQNAGATWVDEKVVRDRNWVSSRGPQDLPAFCPAMVELFAEKAPLATAPLRRPVRWVALTSRLASLAALSVLALAGRVGMRALERMSARRRRQQVAAKVLGLASTLALHRRSRLRSLPTR